MKTVRHLVSGALGVAVLGTALAPVGSLNGAPFLGSSAAFAAGSVQVVPDGVDPDYAGARGPVARWGSTFALNSKPGSAHTLWINASGATVTGTRWNSDQGTPTLRAAAFSVDNDTAHFSRLELTAIQSAWATVAEDYAPFDINVTTERPTASALTRASATDTRWGTEVLVTQDTGQIPGCHCGGKAYVNEATRITSARTPAWVFASAFKPEQNLSARYSGLAIGNAISHEAGHTFGLLHQSLGAAEHYNRQGMWAPIMGASSYAPLTQWSNGRYSGGTGAQDDLAILTATLGARDRAVSGAARSSSRNGTSLRPGRSGRGLISAQERTQRWDVTGTRRARQVRVRVAPVGLTPDLDVRVRVVDGRGRTVAASQPRTRPSSTLESVTGLSASLTFRARPGQRYRVLVSGTGNAGGRGERASGRYLTYSSYGSVGPYRITLTRH